ncbi:hypothetical protein ACEPAG_8327 [Sanghuangporus baumii]
MLEFVFLVLFLLQLFLVTTHAALYEDPSQLAPNKVYDYIVVGGGAAGGMLSNRLSEAHNLNILLIEAGSSDFQNTNIEVPALASRLPNSQFDWNFTTVNQESLNNRSIPYTRGFVLGGSTSINFMTYTRGSSDDYDRWANVTDDEGWSWNSLQPYIRKLDKVIPPVDGHNTTGQFDPSVHGQLGHLGISLPGILRPTDDRILEASAQLSTEFPFNLDCNSGNMIGVGWTQSTIANGERDSSAVAYIAPALSRSNLDVLVNTRVTRVIQTGMRHSIPEFRAVEIATSSNSTLQVLNARREVILSAGAVKSPQILMLSGIGDASHLSSHSIKSIVDLPDVGRNLQDHPLVTVSWTVNSTNTLDNLTEDATFFQNQLDLWVRNRTGLLGSARSSQIGWVRLPDNASIFSTIPDPSAGLTSAHYEFIFTNGFVSFSEPFPSDGGHFFTILIAVVSPTSRGKISLSSSNPFDSPVISPDLLGSEFDIFTMREGIKAARHFVSAPAWDGWILEEHGAFSQAHTDEEIEQYSRNTATTIFHASGTVAMGKTGTIGAGSGALNSDLTVKGTIGLRVVDASAFPFIVAAHTQAATYILAERVSDLIKDAFRIYVNEQEGVVTSAGVSHRSVGTHICRT